jgi:hypothetical protein
MRYISTPTEMLSMARGSLFLIKVMMFAVKMGLDCYASGRAQFLLLFRLLLCIL